MHGAPRPRVLVTGFCDWDSDDLARSSWRCVKNPSGMLLVGAWEPTTPASAAQREGGPLPRLLRAHDDYHWEFMPLRVRWGAGAQIPWDSHDVVVSLGLNANIGVVPGDGEYDEIHVENGAYNLRVDRSARPAPLAGDVVAGAPVPRWFAQPAAVHAVLEALDGARCASYRAVVVHPRASNAYICNETNYHGIMASRAAADRPRATVFLHLPYAPGQPGGPPFAAGASGLDALARGVAGVILRFLAGLAAVGRIDVSPSRGAGRSGEST